MNTYLSWAGDESRKAASALCHAISEAIPETGVFLSGQDIQVGQPWLQTIVRQLREAQACLIVVTPSNLASPWMHFEAGAMAGRDVPVIPVLVGVQPSQLTSPLNSYQCVTKEPESLTRLLTHLGARGNRVGPIAERLSLELSRIALEATDADRQAMTSRPLSAAFDKAWENELNSIEPPK